MGLSKQDKKDFFALCRRLAGLVKRAAGMSVRASSRDLYPELRIAAGVSEREHRRFMGRYWPRGAFTIDQAVDFFVVRTLAEADENATAAELSELREDYLRATFLAADKDFNLHLDRLVSEAWPGGGGWRRMFAVVSKMDYAALTGTTSGEDEGTRAAMTWARAEAGRETAVGAVR